MPPPRNPAFQPVVRIAPLGELNAYIVYEHELDTLAHGSPGSIWLSFALGFLPFAGGVLVTMRSSVLSDLNFVIFTCLATIFALAGFICLGVWWKTHVSTRKLVEDIKRRMPPPPGTQTTTTPPPLLPGFQATTTTPPPPPPQS